MYIENSRTQYWFLPFIALLLAGSYFHPALGLFLILTTAIILGLWEKPNSLEIEDFKLIITYKAPFKTLRYVEHEIKDIRTESNTKETLFSLDPVMELRIFEHNKQMFMIKSHRAFPTFNEVRLIEMLINQEITRYESYLKNEPAITSEPIPETEEQYHVEPEVPSERQALIESRFIAAYNNYLLSFPYYGQKDLVCANSEWLSYEDITISVGSNYRFSKSARWRGLSFNIPVWYVKSKPNLCRLASNELENAIYMLDDETGEILIGDNDFNNSQRCAVNGESFLLAQIEALNLAALKQAQPERLTEAYILSVQEKAIAIAGGPDYSEYYEWYIHSCITE